MDKENVESLKQEALKLYKEGKSVKEIQTILGKSESVVYTYLRDTNAGVVTREEKARKKREKAIKLYTEDKLTLKQISDMLGIAITTLYKYLKRENIPLRENSTGVSLAKDRKKIKFEETMKIYMEENKSIAKTAKRLGVTEKTVRNRLGNIIKQKDKKPVRHSESQSTSNKPENKERTKNLLEEGKTGEEIAKIIGVSVRTVYSYFKELGVNKRKKTPAKSDKKPSKPKKVERNKVKEKPPKKIYTKPIIKFKQNLRQKEVVVRDENLRFPPIPENVRDKLPADFLHSYRNVRDKLLQNILTTTDINSFWKSIKQNRKIADIIDVVFISKLYEYIGDGDTAKKVLFKELEDWRKVVVLMNKQKPTNPIMEENYRKTQEKANVIEEKIQERLNSLAIGEKTRYYIDEQTEK